jgi:hypothetical protein
MQEITLVPNKNIGSATLPDGSPVVLDSLLTSNCRLSFPKLQGVQFWLQNVNLPQINVTEVKQPTRFVDPNQIGEKLKFTPFSVIFTVDKYMSNWSSIFNWMKAMTVDGSSVDLTDDVVLIINNTEILRFVGAWPTILGGLEFSATAPEATYVKSSLTINYDYIDLLQNTTVDSSYK